MPVEVVPNPYHPTRDIVLLRDPWTADEVRDAAAANPRPLMQKAIPGTDKHARLMAAGGRIYQQCPPLHLDVDTPEVAAWVTDHALLPVVDAAGVDLLELWTSWYEVIHRGWAPTAPHEALAGLFTELAAEIDPYSSSLCRIDGRVIAVAFVFPGDEPPCLLTEALEPEHRQAKDAVASCMARSLALVSGVVIFDGHVSDPHFAPLWATVPGVIAGSTDPLDLIEISATAV